MKIRDILHYFVNDPLLGAFFMRGDFDSEYRKAWNDSANTIVDESGETTREERTTKPDWLEERQDQETLVMFIIELVSLIDGDQFISELHRLKKSIPETDQKEFYSQLSNFLSDESLIDRAVGKLSKPRVDAKIAKHFEDDKEFILSESGKSNHIYQNALKSLQSICRAIDNEFVTKHVSINHDTLTHDSTNENEPPFIWLKGGRTLAELILFLSTGGWMKLNPKVFEDTNDLAIGLTKLFWSTDSKSNPTLFTKKSFTEYFTKLTIDSINTISQEKLYNLPSKRMGISDRTFHPFESLLKKER